MNIGDDSSPFQCDETTTTPADDNNEDEQRSGPRDRPGDQEILSVPDRTQETAVSTGEYLDSVFTFIPQNWFTKVTLCENDKGFLINVSYV